jgi:hypothetical protein
MRRGTLSLAAVAVATAACLLVQRALREAPPPEPPVAAAPARPAPGSEEAPAPRSAPDGESLLAERARAAAAEEQALRDAILGVANAEDLPLDARLDRYRQAVDAARAEAPDAPIFAQPSVLAEAFLRMEGVQRTLAALSPADRSRELAHIRRELGYDDEEIARMEDVDARREARWQNGRAYMQERARLAASFEGDALAEELHALREEYFGAEAPTIEAEERGGFLRFERPRIYGRN